jgi:outer membrane protein OmpU
MTETEGKIMKKILIATTALVATAGVAAADVNLSGYARFGAVYNEAADTTTVASRFRMQADVSTTTDAGVGLNARQRFQTEENAVGNGGNGVRFGLTYAGFAVNVGNINGVIESTPNLYLRSNSAGIGLEGNGLQSLVLSNWTAYSSGAAGATNGVEVIYSANGLRLHAHDTGNAATPGATAYGASYAMGDVTVAAAYEDFDAGGSATLLTAGMNLGMGWVAIAHGIQESAAGVDTDETAIKGGYDVAPGTNVYGFVKNADAGTSSGIGLSYDLGGGAAFDAGYTNDANSNGTLSAGIFFTF